MELKLAGVLVHRDAHPNTLFATLRNAAGETVEVQVHFAANLNVDHFTLADIEKMAHEAARKLAL